MIEDYNKLIEDKPYYKDILAFICCIAAVTSSLEG